MNEKETLANVMDFVENELIKTVQTLRPNVTREGARNMIGKIGARILFGKDLFDKDIEKYMKGEK